MSTRASIYALKFTFRISINIHIATTKHTTQPQFRNSIMSYVIEKIMAFITIIRCSKLSCFVLI